LSGKPVVLAKGEEGCGRGAGYPLGVALGALWPPTSYNATMAEVSTARVSHRGQTNLPAELRRRWGIVGGGEVGIIDLGDAALIVPGGVDRARQELRRVLRDRYEVGLGEIDDADLTDQ
jgi:bifunctional DNA-binding transcriptional regulator/antitoxin component of YhaV-PrlF toxin-antitoxin module